MSRTISEFAPALVSSKLRARIICYFLSASFGIVHLFPVSSFADTLWQASTSDWFAPGNWTAGVPDSSAISYINNGGTAQIAAGTAAASSIKLGQNSMESGSLTISGGSLAIGIQEAVGVAGTGTITHTAGSNNLGTGVVVMGVSANSNGTYNLSGTGVVSGSEYIGESGVGTMNQSGGTNNATTIFMASANSNTTGTYNLSGGTLTATSIMLGYQGTGIFSQTGGTFSVSQGITMSNSNSVLSIANALDSTGSLGNGGLVSLAGATMGATAGQLNVTGSYSQFSQRELDIGIGGPNAGTDYGLLNVAGSATLTGTLKVTLTNGFTPINGEVFNIINYQSHTGTFSSVNLPTINGHFNVNYASTGVTLTTVVVPEPSTLSLLGLGVIALIVARRRRLPLSRNLGNSRCAT
jgi:hypothetical protein